MARRRRYKRSSIGCGPVALVTIILVGVLVWLVANVELNIGRNNVTTIEVGTNFNDEVKASWFGFDITDLLKMEGEIDTNKIGKYTIRYKIPFSWKTYERVIKVVDSVAPIVTLNGREEVFVEDFSKFVEPGFAAVDNYDGDLTKNVKLKVTEQTNSSYLLEYYVLDSSGNIGVATRRVTLRRGVVYLTFDDGPSADITPQILNILEEKGVQATFFLVGYDWSKEWIVTEAYNDGHTIALHGMSHDYKKVYQSADSVMENFYDIQQRVYDTIGIKPMLIRFPGGSSNTVSKKYCRGVMTEVTQRAEEEGFTYFDWNVDSQDAGGARNAEEVYYNVTTGLRAGRNIVLMHDSAGNQKTVDALSRIIDYCFKNNYEIRVIDETTNPIHHNIAN